MASFQHPIICVGHTSVSVGIAFNRIAKKVEFSPLRMLFVDDDISDDSPAIDRQQSNVLSLKQYLSKSSSVGVKDGRSVAHHSKRLIQYCHLPRCCHHYMQTSVTCSICRDRVAALHSQCEAFLESFESYSTITIIAEINTALSVWTYDQLLNMLEMYNIRSKLQTILLKPPCQLCGIEHAWAIYVSALALQLSCAVVIRGYDEYLLTVDTDATKPIAPLDFADISYLIACDLWPILIPNNGPFFDESQYILWPHHFVSKTCKVIDIRTSLHKTFSKMEKSNRKTNGELDLRAPRLLSSNVHHLHLVYAAYYGTQINDMGNSDMHLASYNTMVLDTKLKEARFVYPSQFGEGGDFTSLLTWATNGFPWTVLEESTTIPVYNQSLKLAGHPVVSTSSTQIKMAVVIFDSPYAKQDLFSYCEKTKNILVSGAYSHRLHHESSYISLDAISDAISVVESYLDPSSPFR